MMLPVRAREAWRELDILCLGSERNVPNVLSIGHVTEVERGGVRT
jgi:hypothetical protein